MTNFDKYLSNQPLAEHNIYSSIRSKHGFRLDVDARFHTDYKGEIYAKQICTAASNPFGRDPPLPDPRRLLCLSPHDPQYDGGTQRQLCCGCRCPDGQAHRRSSGGGREQHQCHCPHVSTFLIGFFTIMLFASA